MNFVDALQKLAHRESLTRSETNETFAQLMKGDVSPVQIAALLVALRVKGETAAEIAGAAEAMREAAVPVQVNAPLIVDTCGTGGDGKGCFNVSTAAAFVVAGAGFVVAKHGNRSVSSRSGSADVLESLGVTVDPGVETVERLLAEAKIAFLFAPAFHPATKYAMPIRRELGLRTIFNLLGPLTNPARPHVQLIGVYETAWLKPLANALVEMGTTDSVIVHGQGTDEIVLSGPTQIVELVNGQLHLDEWWPEDFGLKTDPDEELRGGSPSENADQMRRLLEGETGPIRDAVCMNAAALIRAASRSPLGGVKILSLKEAFRVATEAIDSKAALRKLELLKAASGKAVPS